MNKSRRQKRVVTSRRVAPVLLCLLMPVAAVIASGQSAPVEVGSPLYNSFEIPTVSGSLHYSLSASERVTIGYDTTDELANFATISGDLGYLSASIVHPFQMTYSGGYLATTTGQPSAFFQNLSLTQTYNTKYWKFTAQDTVSYLPESPSTGFSGIPGVGDLGVAGATDNDGVLTPYATRVSNDASLDVSRALTGRTSLDGTVFYGIQRFLGNSGLETNDLTGRGTLTHRVDALTSVSADYSYSRFSYLGQPGAFTSQTSVFDFTRKITRKLEISAGAGPEYVDSFALTGRAPYFTFSARAHVDYAGSAEHGAAYSVNYARATNSGNGTTYGAESDSVSGTASRRFTRSLAGSVQVQYQESTGLQAGLNQQLDTKSAVASAQLNRAIGRTLSVFFSYTFEHQIYSGIYQGVAPLNGNSQILGIGLTYSPAQIHLGRQ